MRNTLFNEIRNGYIAEELFIFSESLHNLFLLMITIHEGFLRYERNSVDYSLFYLISELAFLLSLYFLKILDRQIYYILLFLLLILSSS